MSKLHRPAGCCRFPSGIHRSVPRVGSAAWPTAAGPRMGHTARWSLPVPGWSIPLGPSDGPHRPAGRCRSPGGLHRPAYRCRSPGGIHRSVPRWAAPLGRPLLVPGWAAPPGWPLPVPEWDAHLGWPLPVPVGLYARSPGVSHRPVGRCWSQVGSPRVGSTTRLAAAHPRVGWHAHPV